MATLQNFNFDNSPRINAGIAGLTARPQNPQAERELIWVPVGGDQEAAYNPRTGRYEFRAKAAAPGTAPGITGAPTLPGAGVNGANDGRDADGGGGGGGGGRNSDPAMSTGERMAAEATAAAKSQSGFNIGTVPNPFGGLIGKAIDKNNANAKAQDMLALDMFMEKAAATDFNPPDGAPGFMGPPASAANPGLMGPPMSAAPDSAFPDSWGSVELGAPVGPPAGTEPGSPGGPAGPPASAAPTGIAGLMATPDVTATPTTDAPSNASQIDTSGANGGTGATGGPDGTDGSGVTGGDVTSTPAGVTDADVDASETGISGTVDFGSVDTSGANGGTGATGGPDGTDGSGATGGDVSSSSDGGGGGGGGGGCFLTSAAVAHMKQKDNGKVLTTLREFRDSYMRKNKEKSKDVAWYYENAPHIVAALDKRPDADKVYKKMYRDFIKPAYDAIQEGDNEYAYEIYKDGIDFAKKHSGVGKKALTPRYGPNGMAAGGIASLAGGGMGQPSGYAAGGRFVRGPGDGVSDSVPASINGVQPARIADGEFIFPARIVSELGNGSSASGARKLQAMVDRIQAGRKKSTGKGKVAVDSKPDKHLLA